MLLSKNQVTSYNSFYDFRSSEIIHTECLQNMGYLILIWGLYMGIPLIKGYPREWSSYFYTQYRW